jgi:hypothetical protein
MLTRVLCQRSRAAAVKVTNVQRRGMASSKTPHQPAVLVESLLTLPGTDLSLVRCLCLLSFLFFTHFSRLLGMCSGPLLCRHVWRCALAAFNHPRLATTLSIIENALYSHATLLRCFLASAQNRHHQAQLGPGSTSGSRRRQTNGSSLRSPPHKWHSSTKVDSWATSRF